MYFTHANLSSCSRGDDGYSGAARGGRAEAGVVQMHVVLRSMWKIVRSVLTLTGVTFLFFAVARILVQVIDPKEHVAKVQTLKERIWYLGDPIDGAFLSRPRTHAPTPLVGLGLVPSRTPPPRPSYPSSLPPSSLLPLPSSPPPLPPPLFLLPLLLPLPSYLPLVYPFPSPRLPISRHHLEADLLSAPDLRILEISRSLAPSLVAFVHISRRRPGLHRDKFLPVAGHRPQPQFATRCLATAAAQRPGASSLRVPGGSTTPVARCRGPMAGMSGSSRAAGEREEAWMRRVSRRSRWLWSEAIGEATLSLAHHAAVTEPEKLQWAVQRAGVEHSIYTGAVPSAVRCPVCCHPAAFRRPAAARGECAARQPRAGDLVDCRRTFLGWWKLI